MFDGFRVEAGGGVSLESFARFQFVENRRLANPVEAGHQNPHLFLAEKHFEQARERASNAALHGCRFRFEFEMRLRNAKTNEMRRLVWLGG